MTPGADGAFRLFPNSADGLPLTVEQADILNDRFQLGVEGRLRVFYAPFDGENKEAVVTIIGITPGWTQVESAYGIALAAWHRGVRDPHELGRLAKATASFKGMRGPLVDMLDQIGVPAAVSRVTGRSMLTSASLFEADRHLLHTTSAVRYPAFIVDGKRFINYSGRRPDLVKSPLLMGFVRGVLQPELTGVKKSLLVALGQQVYKAVQSLGDSSGLPRRTIYVPHPSGANNGHRVHEFPLIRETLKTQVATWAKGVA